MPNSNFTIEDVDKYNVIDTCYKLNHTAHGQGDMQSQERDELLDWLAWRVGDSVWVPSSRSDYVDFDRHVRRMAAAVLLQFRRHVRVP